MKTTESAPETASGSAAAQPDRDRELVRAITDALVLAVGKRAAHQALRHARSRHHADAQRRADRLHLPSAADLTRHLTAGGGGGVPAAKTMVRSAQLISPGHSAGQCHDRYHRLFSRGFIGWTEDRTEGGNRNERSILGQEDGPA